MVMISLKENDLTSLAWILTHRDIIGRYEGLAQNFLIILKKLKKGAKKGFNKRVIQGKIDAFIEFYPEFQPKTRVKK